MLTSKQLTNGERLILVRRREGRSKADAAEEHGTTLYRYNLWEKGRDPAPKVAVGRIRAHEGLMLLRLRAGIKLRDQAAEMDVSPWWLTQLEAGEAPIERLAEHWNQIDESRLAELIQG